MEDVFFWRLFVPICRCTLCFKGWFDLPVCAQIFGTWLLCFQMCGCNLVGPPHRRCHSRNIMAAKSSKDVEQLFFKIHSGSISQHIFPSFFFPLARRLIIIDRTSLPSETFLSGWTSWRSSWCFGFGEVGDSGLSAEMLVVVTPLRLAVSEVEVGKYWEFASQTTCG